MKRLSINEVIKAFQQNFRNAEETLRDDADGIASPLFFIRSAGKRQEDTKQQFIDVFTMQVHAVSSDTNSVVEINNMVETVENIMFHDIKLSEPYSLLVQIQDNVTAPRREESGEWHAVLTYIVKVSYGYKFK